MRKNPLQQGNMPTGAHPGQARSAARKRARQIANKTALSQEAEKLGITIAQLRQRKQSAVDNAVADFNNRSAELARQSEIRERNRRSSSVDAGWRSMWGF